MNSTLSVQGTLPVEIIPLIEKCLENERNRKLSERTIRELRIQFNYFKDYCKKKNVVYVKSLTAGFFKLFADFIGKKNRPGQAKAAIWTMRKFGAYLALYQYLPHNPAAHIPHPKLSPRAILPTYLTPDELAAYLETAVTTRTLRDVAVVSLLATTGLRSNEIASLRLKSIDLNRKLISVKVKGGWVKVLPLSKVMCKILKEYVEDTEFSGEHLFYNNRQAPIDKTWVLRLSKAVGRDAKIKKVVTPRVMRHTFGTYMADRNGKQVTRMFLGHGASRSTDVYMHLVPGKFREYANKHPYNRFKRRGKK